MGNTNKRSASRASHAGAQWDEENVLRMIAENKLAPKHIEKDCMNKSCSECPICFLDFSLLNTVHCCKQSICTECVVQLKCIEGKGACPFCGNVEMQVSLISPDPSTKSSNSINNKEACVGDSDPPSSRSSESSRVSLSYTTPEQERKLRTFSQDLSTNLATKNDREELERQIREQRMHFDERNIAEAARFNCGSYFNGGGPGRFSSRERVTTTQRASRHRGSIFVANSMGSPGSNARLTTRTRSAVSGDNEDNIEGSLLSPSRRLANSIEGLLGSRAPLGGISSLDQLEDIMLMEAIRLSMQDASPSEQVSHSSRDATMSFTAANQNMTCNSQSNRNDLRMRMDNSGSDEDYVRESEILSDEEEQMRLALEMSLTSLRNETSTVVEQDQNQPAKGLWSTPKESSERDVIYAPTDMVTFAEAPSDCPLSADDVDVDVVGGHTQQERTQTNLPLEDEAPITKLSVNDNEGATPTTGFLS